MQWQVNVTPILFGVLILALMGAVLGMAMPEINKVLNVQNTVKIQQAQAESVVASEQAKAAVAPTLTYMEVISRENAIRFQKAYQDAQLALLQTQADNSKKEAEANTIATLRKADGDAETNKQLATAVTVLAGAVGLCSLGGILGFAFHKRQSKKEDFLLESGKINVRIEEVKVIRQAVDMMAQSGGSITLENGRTLQFEKKLEPVMIEAPKQQSHLAQGVENVSIGK